MSKSQQTIPRKSRLNEQLVGKSITVGQRTIVPVAHLRGLHVSGEQDVSRFGNALLRITPTEIQVNDEKDTYTISIEDPNRTPLFAIAILSIAISTICWLIMWRLEKTK
ncbi:hypothetical protein KFU94_04500 [Chloroflexi bacterium TSY]|nr:hypothetical protein [Chloroflexi bacterium TSY]